MPPAESGNDVPVVIPRPEHNVSRANISRNAQKVLYRLHNAGYMAFLVGGAVRDLLLGHEPKDFDIATDAHPDDIKRLFRNCRLIGRRFRLAHVHFGREVIEVATFRAAHDSDGPDSPKVVLDDTGRILRDNLYGDIAEDVWRRDFTANALYYNIADYSIWDYANGVADIEAGVMRLIGDPLTRYREDPVRMLRAVRFAAKLGFRINKETEEPLFSHGALLEDVPAARLFDECLKLFLGGFALQCFELLQRYGLFSRLLPATATMLEHPDAGAFRDLVVAGLRSTDDRVAIGKPVTPIFLFAVFLWGPINNRAARLRDEEHMSELQSLIRAADIIIHSQQSTVSVPRRLTLPVRDILCMQPKMRRRGAVALKVLAHPRFRAAYDLLLLRVAAGEETEELAEWWTHIQTLDHDERIAAVKASGGSSQPRGPRKRRRRRSGKGNAPAGAS